MPVFPCKWATCNAYVDRRGGYCPAHVQHGREVRREQDRAYEMGGRDQEARRFYKSAAWARARTTKLADKPWCERCEKVWARHVHHRVPFELCTIEQRIAQSNLMAVCITCHNIEEAEAARLRRMSQ